MNTRLIALLFAVLSLAASLTAQQATDNCTCKNVMDAATDKKTVATTTVPGQNGAPDELIFIASMRYSIDPENGRCQNDGACRRDPKDCKTTISGTVTVHSDAFLRRTTGSNAVMVDGNPVSEASGPTAVEDSDSTACGGVMRPRIEANEAISGNSLLWVEAFRRCQSCLGISDAGNLGGANN